MKLMSILVNFILLIFGLFFIFWGIVCFIGGPDGRTGSLESLVWGGGYVAVGILLFIILIRRGFVA